MPIKHPFASAKGDPGDTTLVKPSDWNTSHNAPPFVVTFIGQGTGQTWTDMPAALTEFNSGVRSRTALDLTYVDQVRMTLVMLTAGAAGAEIRFQYSTDSGSTWNYLDGVSGPAVSIGSTGLKVSSWVTLAAGAKADVWVRPIGINGDGAADPVFAMMTLQLR